MTKTPNHRTSKSSSPFSNGFSLIVIFVVLAAAIVYFRPQTQTPTQSTTQQQSQSNTTAYDQAKISSTNVDVTQDSDTAVMDSKEIKAKQTIGQPSNAPILNEPDIHTSFDSAGPAMTDPIREKTPPQRNQSPSEEAIARVNPNRTGVEPVGPKPPADQATIDMDAPAPFVPPPE
jgi:hypothetical protein